MANSRAYLGVICTLAILDMTGASKLCSTDFASKSFSSLITVFDGDKLLLFMDATVNEPVFYPKSSRFLVLAPLRRLFIDSTSSSWEDRLNMSVSLI